MCAREKVCIFHITLNEEIISTRPTSFLKLTATRAQTAARFIANARATFAACRVRRIITQLG